MVFTGIHYRLLCNSVFPYKQEVGATEQGWQHHPGDQSSQKRSVNGAGQPVKMSRHLSSIEFIEN